MAKLMKSVAKRARAISSAAEPATRGDGAVTAMGEARILTRVSNKIENKLLSGEGYDVSNFEIVNSIVREGAVCFDIGANIGVYSVVFSRLSGSTGEVHSFEPVRHIRRRLEINLALNGARNAVVNDFALGEEVGELEMLQVKEGVFRGGTSTFIRNDNVAEMGDEAFEKEKVRIETLDRYIAEKGVTRIDFMKIDVEGFEIMVLKGARETLSRFKPAILFEHDQERLAYIKRPESELGDFLRELGYVCFEIFMHQGRANLAEFRFDRKIKGNNLLALHLPSGAA